jgi:two-component system KDP operon response regulator KdpE
VWAFPKRSSRDYSIASIELSASTLQYPAPVSGCGLPVLSSPLVEASWKQPAKGRIAEQRLQSACLRHR